MLFDHYKMPANIEVSDDDLAVQESTRRFAREVLHPDAAQLDEESIFAGKHLTALGELGVMGLNLPAGHGGSGISPSALLLAVEAIAGACASTASMVTAHYLATDALLLGADARLQSRYLDHAASGKILGAFALTEPEAGSNPADMRCRSERIDGGYRIRGNKQFISNARHADFLVVFAKTDKSPGHRGISAFVVDNANGGIEAGKAEKTMGLKGGHVFPVTLDCLVPEENRIGAEGDGFRIAMQVLDNGRVEVAAICLGIAQAAFSAACDWAKQRHVGDRPIAEFQGIQWMLADMATELEAARLLALNAAALRGQGVRFSRESAMAKLYCSEMVTRIADRALQIHGGYGYSREFPLERYVRDARIMRIYEGSSEVQRNIIARQILNTQG